MIYKNQFNLQMVIRQLHLTSIKLSGNNSHSNLIYGLCILLLLFIPCILQFLSLLLIVCISWVIHWHLIGDFVWSLLRSQFERKCKSQVNFIIPLFWHTRWLCAELLAAFSDEFFHFLIQQTGQWIMPLV